MSSPARPELGTSQRSLASSTRPAGGTSAEHTYLTVRRRLVELEDARRRFEDELLDAFLAGATIRGLADATGLSRSKLQRDLDELRRRRLRGAGRRP